MIAKQIEHNNHQSINFNLLTKPEMQFDFLKEKYLISTDSNNASETSSPVEEFDLIKNLIYDDKDEMNDFDESSSIEAKLASEYFQDYKSDSASNGCLKDLECILEEQLIDEFEEANDDLIDLYASAISGLSIGNQTSNQTNYAGKQELVDKNELNKIRLRKQVEDKIERFKQKNRFSQQISYSNVNQTSVPKTKDDLALRELANLTRKQQDDWFNDAFRKDEESVDSSSEEDEFKVNFKKNESLKESLDNLNKQISLLDEAHDRSLNNAQIKSTNVLSNQKQKTIENEQSYQDRLNELSDWSIETIVRKCDLRM